MARMRPLLFCLALITLTGCSGTTTIAPPKYSPAAEADAAMSEFDKNNDGKLDDKELERCAALRNAVAELDKDNDKAISRDELLTQLTEFAQGKVALQTANCKILRGETPAANVEVQFIPEKFHGGALKPAKGKSDARGNVELRSEGSDLPGISLGFYRIELSLKDAGGSEALPANYNRQSTQGRMVHGRMRGAIEIRIP